MRNKIFLFIAGALMFASCSEDFITRDLDKSQYLPSTFFDTKEKANLALNAIYANLRNNNWWNWHHVFGDDFDQTGFAAGFAPWPLTIDFNIRNSDSNVANIWNMSYTSILRANLAIQEMPLAQEKASAIDPAAFTKDDLDLMMGQAYFLRALAYYNLYWYYPDDKIILRETPPAPENYTQAPSTSEETFAFIEADLKEAQKLLVKGISSDKNYEKFRATRGAAAALLGNLYMYKEMYTEAAAEYKKILPGVGDAAYGTYSLVDDYRRNFTIAGENTNSSVNTESIFEIYYEDLSVNMTGSFLQNMTLNRTMQDGQWWNFAIPTFKLNEFETWEEEINGTTTTVYDYRAYQTFWGIPNGAKYTQGNGTVLEYDKQGWDKESVGGGNGSLGMRKLSYDSDAEFPSRGFYTSEVNPRYIRLGDIMLRYAECLAIINPGATGVDGAAYWIDQVRTRANNPMDDQEHLYSARPGVRGKLPPVSELMAAKGWTIMQAIEHERYVEGYAEGWSREDTKRWKRGIDYIDTEVKPGWKGYQSLTLPVPLQEEQRNPNMPQ